jgi:hypothetical protein
MAADDVEHHNTAPVAEKDEKSGHLDEALGREHEIEVGEHGKLARNLRGRHMQVRLGAHSTNYLGIACNELR